MISLPTHIPRVKICGIASLEDAHAAIALGTDAVGLLVGLLYETADQLQPEQARDIAVALPPFVNSVLVTHQTAVDSVRALLEIVQPNVVQLHGPFELSYIGILRHNFPYLKIIKAIHVQDEHAVEVALATAPYVDGVLLDTKVGTRLGGTGVTHDWSISRRICEELSGTAVILAGGLRPDNVASAIETVRPYGVDVNSGVSLHPGKKSISLLHQFISKAKSVHHESVATETSQVTPA